MIYDSSIKFIWRYCKLVFLLFFLVNNAFSDVVRLEIPGLRAGFPSPEGEITDNTFAAFAKANAKALPDQLFSENGFQMLGYSAFIPLNGNPRVYAAKKRLTILSDVPDNSPGTDQNYANLFNYNACMHTERQLAIAALEEQLSPNVLTSTGMETLTASVLDIPKAIDVPDLSKLAAVLQGELHIYTNANPCQNYVGENGSFSCIDYYNALASFCKCLKIHVYFSKKEMRLNKEFFGTKNFDSKAVISLFDFICSNKIKDNHVKIDGNYLQYNGKTLFQYMVNDNEKEKFAKTAVQNGDIRLLVTAVNKCLQAETIDNAAELFNKVHNAAHIANLTYHPI